MSRPLRIEFAGALYHITSRGNARQDIFHNDEDREHFLLCLADACDHYRWECHAYCLMSNHYHLLVETHDATLSAGMKAINGPYTQWFNRRHERVGHLLQGRFNAIIVEKEGYLLELARYIVLNPVRAQMVNCPEEWPWSSYRATAGLCEPPSFLSTDFLLGQFASRLGPAISRYREHVAAGREQLPPWRLLCNQIFLGSEAFVEDLQGRVDPERSLEGVPACQRRAPPKPLTHFATRHADRKRAMAEAYRSGHYTLAQIATHFGVASATVSRAVNAARGLPR